MSHFLQLRIKIVNESGDGQPAAVALRFVEAYCQVLAHEIDGKAEVEFPLQHGSAAIFHLPRLRRAFRYCVDNPLPVQARLFGKSQRLGESLYQTCNTDLIDHLGKLAGTDRPHQLGGACVARNNRQDPLVRSLITADHNGQHAVFGASFTAGNGGVQKLHTFVERGVGELSGDRGRSGCMIDEDGPACLWTLPPTR
jgi:hypothetical protein